MEPEKERSAQGRVSRSAARAAYDTPFGIAGYPPADQVGARGRRRSERNAAYEAKWAGGRQHQLPLCLHRPAGEQGSNDTASEFVRNKIRAMVKDPRTAELLAPKDHPIGTKRLCLDTNYYETYNRDNVTLVDVRSEPIKEITATGLRTARRPSTSSTPSSSPPASTP